MTTDDLHILELRDSVAWAAGQQYERRRIGELLRQRAVDLRALQEGGLPRRTVEALTAEICLLVAAIEQEPA